MLFRSRNSTPPAVTRFRPREDLFAFRKEGELFVAEVAAGLERSVDLLHALTEQLPQVVDFSMECYRTNRRYLGEGLQLSEVREAIARLKVPLVASGGVEIAVFNADEQLSLSGMLDLWIYSKSDRWLYLLQGRGLEECAELPRRSWTLKRDDFAGGSELVDAVTAAAERLTLKLV
jgi:hypothetical protein